MRRRAAFTLIEILTVAFLSLIVLGLVLALMVPSFSLYRKQAASSTTYQSALVFIHRVTQGLLNTQLESVTIGDNPPAISWQKIDTERGFSVSTGEPIMDDRFVIMYYDQATRRILSEEVPAPPSASDTLPVRLSDSQLRDFCNNVSGDEAVVAREVTLVEFTDADEDVTLLNPPIRVSVECTVDTSEGGAIKEEKFAMTARVTPRSMRW